MAALAPELRCIAPLREWELKSREQEIEWAREHGIPVTATHDSPYSIDENLWGMAIECGRSRIPGPRHPTTAGRPRPTRARRPTSRRRSTVGFECGVPSSLDGERLDGPVLIARLNELAGAHGVGRLDIVEDRLVGIKSREVYEAPAAVTLHAAREALEQITLDRETRRVKAELGQQLARLVYDGLWFTPLRLAIQAFVDAGQRTGDGRGASDAAQGSRRRGGAALRRSRSTTTVSQPTVKATLSGTPPRRASSRSSAWRHALREPWRGARRPRPPARAGRCR